MAFTPTYAKLGDSGYDIFGATPVAIYTITFSAGDTYVAGGLPLTAAIFGLSRPLSTVQVIGVNTAAFVTGWQWNTQTQKLMGLTVGATPAAFVDLVAATALAGYVLTALAMGQR